MSTDQQPLGIRGRYQRIVPLYDLESGIHR
jgi:hypothetical protein